MVPYLNLFFTRSRRNENCYLVTQNRFEFTSSSSRCPWISNLNAPSLFLFWNNWLAEFLVLLWISVITLLAKVHLVIMKKPKPISSYFFYLLIATVGTQLAREQIIFSMQLAILGKPCYTKSRWDITYFETMGWRGIFLHDWIWAWGHFSRSFEGKSDFFNKTFKERKSLRPILWIKLKLC